MADQDREQESFSAHEAIFFILSYLPLYELLVMTRVCKSLRDAINDDILPWLRIIVDSPINSRLSDDILMRVASKAKGRLQILALINCTRITDDGLLRVVVQNPRITKLHVPGCTSLSPGGVIKAVKLLTNNNNSSRLNSLKINGVYGFQREHLETLHNLINHNHQTQHKTAKILYHEHKKLSSAKQTDTDGSIFDMDICPKCRDVRMVFDCPQVVCEHCRRCETCVARCVECGVCAMGADQELEEASCGEALCLECWLKLLPKCNFCNRPYCSQHADRQHRLEGSVGFVCDACHSEFCNYV